MRFLFALFLLLLSGSSNAVWLSPNGDGDSLIFPYYSNLGGNQTLLQITRANRYFSPATALKLIFRNRQGEVELSFNLYLKTSDTWTASIARVEGEGRLYLPDETCTAPALAGEQGYAVVPLTSGYIEVIQMASSKDNTINYRDCEAVNAAWGAEGTWSNQSAAAMKVPEARIRGVATLVNSQEGTMYAFVATGLNEFNTKIQHTAPEIAEPNLSSGHDSGTNFGETRSKICSASGCVEDTWARPLDALATVLGASFRGEYSVIPEMAAETELIVTLPLAAYYQVIPELEQFKSHVRVLPNSPSGRYILTPQVPGGPIADPPPPYQFTLLSSETVVISSFSSTMEDYGNIVSSGILQEPHEVFMPDDIVPDFYEHGSISIHVYPLSQEGGTWVRVSNSGRNYAGSPAIVYTVQRFKHNELVNQSGERVRANYGNAYKLSRIPDEGYIFD